MADEATKSARAADEDYRKPLCIRGHHVHKNPGLLQSAKHFTVSWTEKTLTTGTL